MIKNRNAGEKIKIDDYYYDLPNEKIAKYPLNKRNGSKLLVYKNFKICEDIFKNISNHLPENSLLVFNNTKVIQARIIFKKETGAKIEIFCLEPINPSEYNLAFQTNNKVIWKCIVGNLKKWKQGSLYKLISVGNKKIKLEVKLINNNSNTQEIEFNWSNKEYTFGDIIQLFGLTPIPPYLNRNSEDIDKERYQTVYSKIQGSVAAPTAGLHFTDKIINNIKNNEKKTEEITLHVGAGTFKPVKAKTINKHEMHTEYFSVNRKTLENIINHKGKIIAVGTTSMRTIESLYWIGIKLAFKKPELYIKQWDPYKLENKISVKESFKTIIEYLYKNNLEELHSKTQMIIIPGYKFKLVNGLITNYHMPKSTLLMLVAAFIGEDWKKVYKYALNNNFRFLSYGDSSLLMKN